VRDDPIPVDDGPKPCPQTDVTQGITCGAGAHYTDYKPAAN